MSLSTWDEIRTAYHVARLGTVSGAADALGVHHATVIRHVDSLEERLGVKLFQRHARGYTSTEAGLDLLQVAQATDDQFTQLVGRIKGRGGAVTGELVVTSLAAISSRLTPVLARFQEQHPGLSVRFLTGEELLRLEYGEAHIAVRAGPAPQQPDNVVQRLCEIKATLFASESYIARHGRLESVDDLDGHVFVGLDGNKRGPFENWLRANAKPDQIVFRTSEARVALDAVRAGVGMGFGLCWDAESGEDLVEMVPPIDEWAAPLWIVTHVDLHRTAKVQSFLKFLKEEAKDW